MEVEITVEEVAAVPEVSLQFSNNTITVFQTPGYTAEVASYAVVVGGGGVGGINASDPAAPNGGFSTLDLQELIQSGFMQLVEVVEEQEMIPEPGAAGGSGGGGGSGGSGPAPNGGDGGATQTSPTH